MKRVGNYRQIMEMEGVTKVAVLGAGNMGHGIAEVVAIAGFTVVMRDITEELVQKGYEGIVWSLNKLVEKGQISEKKSKETLDRITTVVTIEGPRFSTKAESMMFRLLGCDVINMSTVPEICLARELELEYQSIAMTTDYDCWHESEEDVTMEIIFAVMKNNVHNVKELIKHVIPIIKSEYESEK